MPSVTYPDKTNVSGDPNNLFTKDNANELKSVVNQKADVVHTHGVATTSADGFMSAADKTTLVNLAETIAEGDFVEGDDPRLSDPRRPLISVLDHTPGAGDDSDSGFFRGSLVYYDGSFFICASPTPPAAAWLQIGGLGGGSGAGIPLTDASSDPTSAPAVVPSLYRNTSTKQMWIAVGTSDVSDWLLLGTAASRAKPLVTDIGSAPGPDQDSTLGYARGDLVYAGGIIYMNVVSTPAAAQWARLTSGVLMVYSTQDPIDPPPGVPSLYRNTASGGLWVATAAAEATDWTRLVTDEDAMVLPVYDPAERREPVAFQSDIAGMLTEDDWVDDGASINVTGENLTLQLGWWGKKVRLLGDSPVVRIAPHSETAFPANFWARIVSRQAWQLKCGENVSLNGTHEAVFDMEPLPQFGRLSIGGEDDWDLEAQGAVTSAAPSTSGTLPDKSFTISSGVKTVDTASTFVGVGITYSLISPPTGVTIDSGTGIVSVNTGTTGALAGTTITVRATNSVGYAERTFTLTVASVLMISGGTETSPSGYKVCTFDSNGDLVITGSGTLHYELVGGGGAGGLCHGGGGGGGQVKTGTIAVTAGTYAVVIGDAGPTNFSFQFAGGNGTATSVTALSLSAAGGGGGGADGVDTLQGGKDGACGGGGGGADTTKTANTLGGNNTASGHGDGGAGVANATSNNRSGGGGGGAGGNGTAGATGGSGGTGGAGVTSICPGFTDKLGAGGSGWSPAASGATAGGSSGAGGAGGFGTTSPDGLGQPANGKGGGGGGGHSSRGGRGATGTARFWVAV